MSRRLMPSAAAVAAVALTLTAVGDEQPTARSALPIQIHLSHPRDLGLDEEALKRGGFTASASRYAAFGMAPNVIGSIMLHLARDTNAGLELFSRYWIGAHPELRRFPGAEKAAVLVAKMDLDMESAVQLAYEMAVHDVTEFD